MNDELAPKRRASWISVEAHIFSVFWAPKDDFNTERHVVTYSYTVDGELQIGDFTDYSDPSSFTLSRGDKLVILYNPKDPTQSKVPRPNNFGWKQRAAWVIGCVLLILKFGSHFLYGFYKLLRH